jgi:hypothetical protein
MIDMELKQSTKDVFNISTNAQTTSAAIVRVDSDVIGNAVRRAIRLLTKGEAPGALRILSPDPELAASKVVSKPLSLENDRKWEEAFAATTPEQLARLERLFLEAELRDGTEPLDFDGK